MVCPHCGGEIKRNAMSCRHCGSDDSTGWSHDTYMDGIDTPEAGDYEDGLEREGFRKPSAGPSGMAVGVVSGVLIVLFALWLLRGAF